jgi:proline iminopeptidase
MSRFVRLLFVAALAAPAVAGAAELKDGEGFAVSKGVKIWYRVEGAARSGLPILIIHGGPGETARPFERSIGPLLALSRPVVYTDYRGAGRSERPKDPTQYSFAQLADDNEAIREKLGIAAWAVFGHSNGGATAVMYAIRHPKATRALVLCDPLANARDLEINMVHKVLAAPAEDQDKLRALFQSRASTGQRFEKMFDLLRPGWQRAMYYDPANGALFDSIQADLKRELGKPLMAPQLMEGLLASGFFAFDAFAHTRELAMPVLVLVGRVDSEISVDNAAALAASLPAGRFFVVEQAGHFPFLEATATTTSAIERFLHDVH